MTGPQRIAYWFASREWELLVWGEAIIIPTGLLFGLRKTAFAKAVVNLAVACGSLLFFYFIFKDWPPF
jgi:hypothetical protein